MPVATSTVFGGTVTATNGNQPLSGISIASAPGTAMTDGNGGFILTVPGTIVTSLAVSLSGSGVLTRTLLLQGPGHTGIHLDVFQQDRSFDVSFYRKFARNGFEEPAQLQPIHRWTQAPTIYLKTVDEAGQPIDAVTLDTAARAFLGVAGIWSGDHFGLAGIERGTGTRQGVTGYITVKWLNPPATDICGRSNVAVDGGSIELNYLFQPVPGVSGSCGCNGSRIRPRSVRHELGHALGYWHTGDAIDLMSGLSDPRCDQLPSAREVAHARDMYSRPVGNTDPDNDPMGAQSVPFSRHMIVD
jgi:hypothetical protein